MRQARKLPENNDFRLRLRLAIQTSGGVEFKKEGRLSGPQSAGTPGSSGRYDGQTRCRQRTTSAGGLRWFRRGPPCRGSAGPMGSAPSRKTAMTAELVLAAVAKPGKSLRDLRNRAMLLIGFAGAFRRSELIGLDVADVTETDDGLLLHIRRSKTDQEGVARSWSAAIHSSATGPTTW